MQGNGSAKFRFGAVTLIPDERLVLKDGRAVSFTPKAFDLLAVLAANPGRLLTKEQLMQAVWPDTAVEESNLAYHVFAIRRALGESSDADRYIETVPKSGYRFVAPVVRIDAHGQDIVEAAPAEALAAPVGAVAGSVSTGERHADLNAQRPPLRHNRWRLWAGLAAGLSLGALLFPVVNRPRQSSTSAEAVQFQESVIGRLAETGMFSISPDGRQLVYAAEGADGVLRLWSRAMTEPQPVALPGTEVFTIIPPVVWSPDSHFVAFDPGVVLKKVSLQGGATQTVCDVPGTAVGGSWNAGGDILLGNALGGLVRCPSAGGDATLVTGANLPEGERHLFPSFLSDGRHFLYLRVSRADPQSSGVYVGELGAAAPRPSNRLITTGFGAAFVAAVDGGPGLIVFARDGGVFAQRFDERKLALVGSPVRLADRIGSYLDGAFFSVSPTTLVYRSPEPDSQLAWFDRQGRELGRVGTAARFSGLALSPDGARAVVTTQAPQGTASADLWLFELSRTGMPRPMTFEPALEYFPVWSTSERFVYGSGGGDSGVYQQTVGGERLLLFKSGGPEIPTSMTADGEILLYTTIIGAATGGDIWVRSGPSGSAKVKPLIQREKDQWQAQLSPDRRWVAYVSNEAGPNDVFVTAIRDDPGAGVVVAGESIRVSEGGGLAPRWRPDGRELFYVTPNGDVMVIPVDTNQEFRMATAKRLFTVPGTIPEWGVTDNGTRFLFAVPLSPSPPFNFVLNWQARLPKQQ